MLVIVPPIGYSLTGETFVLDCKALAGQVAEALSADKLIYFLPTHGIQDENSQRVSELPKATSHKRACRTAILVWRQGLMHC